MKALTPSVFLRHFAPHIRRERWLVAGSVCALLVEVALRALEPWPLKFVFDYLLADSTDVPSAVATMSPIALLTWASASVVVLVGLRAWASYVNTVGFALAGNRVLSGVRADLYTHLHSLSLSFHNKARSGDLVVRVISDVGMLKDVAVTALMPLLANVLILIVMMGLMAWLNWKLALVVMMLIPLFWLPTIRIGRRIRVVSRRQREREGAMAATAAETLNAVESVQALSLERHFGSSFSGLNSRDVKEGVAARRLAARLERTVDIVIALGTALVLWFGVRSVLVNELTPGELLVFLAYLKAAFKPVQSFAKYTGRLSKASAAAERVVDILRRRPEQADRADAVPAHPLSGNVHFIDVSFEYERQQTVLHGVSLDIRAGQHVALVGPSGSGKSTLLNLILRLYDPTSGRIEFDGRDVRGLTLSSVREQISVVLQDSPLFATSVRENIAYGRPAATFDEICEAAILANAHDFILALPDGYDTVVGERGATLSGGQRRRIAIARAAVRRAPILVLDEPTAGLDEISERAVLEALVRVARGRTTFVSSHDLTFALGADLVLYVENGRIAEHGTHHRLLEMGGRYARLYRMARNTAPIDSESSLRHAVQG